MLREIRYPVGCFGGRGVIRGLGVFRGVRWLPVGRVR